MTIWTVLLAMFLTGCFFKFGELLIETIWPVLQLDFRIRRNYKKVFGGGMDKKRDEVVSRIDAIIVAAAMLQLHHEDYLPHDHADTGHSFVDGHCKWCEIVEHAMNIQKGAK